MPEQQQQLPCSTSPPTSSPLCCALYCCLVAQGDPFKTLFVGRLSYEMTERKLRHEFEEFGPIKRIRLVHDRNTGAVLKYRLPLQQ